MDIGADVRLALGWDGSVTVTRIVYLPVSGAFCDTSVNASDGHGSAGGTARGETLERNYIDSE